MRSHAVAVTSIYNHAKSAVWLARRVPELKTAGSNLTRPHLRFSQLKCASVVSGSFCLAPCELVFVAALPPTMPGFHNSVDLAPLQVVRGRRRRCRLALGPWPSALPVLSYQE